jgi:hypothetical protein
VIPGQAYGGYIKVDISPSKYKEGNLKITVDVSGASHSFIFKQGQIATN